jgi:hypothetical protein
MLIGIPLKGILHTFRCVGKATSIARESLNMCHRSYESLSDCILSDRALFSSSGVIAKPYHILCSGNSSKARKPGLDWV